MKSEAMLADEAEAAGLTLKRHMAAAASTVGFLLQNIPTEVYTVAALTQTIAGVTFAYRADTVEIEAQQEGN